MKKLDIVLRDWKPAHACALRTRNGKLHFADTSDRDWHLMRAFNTELKGKVVTLNISVEASIGCSSDLYVNGAGGIDIAQINMTGKVLKMAGALGVRAELQDNSLTATIRFLSADSFVTIGTARRTAVYPGTGEDQLIFSEIELIVEEASTGCPPLTFVDVGAAGGVQEELVPFRQSLNMIFVEPQHEAAEALRANNYCDFSSVTVVEAALFSSNEDRELYLTRFPQCSSLLRPNTELLESYAVAPCFDIKSTTVVSCSRYETLWQNGSAPKPDVIKADVQGVEYEVLQGFGPLLDECLAIEVEAHLYEIYIGQHLLADIVEMLSARGLFLRRLQPQMSFDGDLVEVNAFFTRHKESTMSEATVSKLEMVNKMWGLTYSSGGAHMVNKYG
ncbi:FkbM family methyltransferase [Bradyrhizobium sp. BR 10261]|uniref:FkbM family methyltransferase n=1 Tax=Bradyrhizobium sp. BR 10261 TaxID=2749992 RepID=UPI001C652E06|nr:FkbM family methyltransferase [Bradyrhizobium sp. BR 10261]MBW7961800.1 FkbM family methyltransferase [Bradyrhizobium sp. BR 10261]